MQEPTFDILFVTDPVNMDEAWLASGLDKPERDQPILARYCLAIVATALSLVLRAALDPILGSYVPYLTVFPAVIFSAWYCGLWPSVLSTILAFLAETYWFIEPRGTLAISHGALVIGSFVYLMAAVFIIWFAESSRRAMTETRLMNQHLDNLVKERTSELEKRNAILVEQADSVRALSSRLLNMRDEERRHIARELHDSVGQLAAVMKMNLGRVNLDSETLPKSARDALIENRAVLDELITSIRTISYLLHPPVLDALGLQAALKWFVEGFSQRSKIEVTLKLPSDDRRLAPEIELHLFRMAQECLTNVYRHSESATAVVRLALGDNSVQLEIADNGRGIPPEKLRALESNTQLGVGIGGMRERVRQFGGTIEITSDTRGTVVRVSVPVRNASNQNVSESPQQESRARGAAAGELAI
jgi:signal transduction histidine kinase